MSSTCGRCRARDTIPNSLKINCLRRWSAFGFITVTCPAWADDGNGRGDNIGWTVSNSTRLMVRYTQDAWKAQNTILWGDSVTSTVGSNWDQPGKSLVAQLNNNIGSKMTNSLTYSYSANKITATRTGESCGRSVQ